MHRLVNSNSRINTRNRWNMSKEDKGIRLELKHDRNNRIHNRMDRMVNNMVLRELTEKEREMTIKGIAYRKELLVQAQEALDMSEVHRQFVNQKREYEDRVRPFNRANEDKQINNTIKENSAEVKINQEVIDELERQLKEGVEVKEVHGVV